MVSSEVLLKKKTFLHFQKYIIKDIKTLIKWFLLSGSFPICSPYFTSGPFRDCVPKLTQYPQVLSLSHSLNWFLSRSLWGTSFFHFKSPQVDSFIRKNTVLNGTSISKTQQQSVLCLQCLFPCCSIQKHDFYSTLVPTDPKLCYFLSSLPNGQFHCCLLRKSCPSV